jgi:hypothetical protein
MVALPQPPSARQRVRDWVQAYINGDTEVTAPAVTDALLDWLRQPSQAELVYDLLAETLGSLVYGEVLSTVAATRGRVARFRLSQERVDALVHQTAGRATTRWTRLLEHAGDRHVLALQMTRDDCRLAASERAQQARGNSAYALLWAAIAEELADGELVQDRFDPEALEARFQALRAVPLDAETAPGVRYRLNGDGRVERVRP